MAIDGYEILGFRVAAGADAPDAHAAVRRVLRGFGPVDVGPGLELPRFEVLSGETWRLRVNGEVVQEDGDLHTSLASLEWYVVSAALAERRDLFQVHAAALCAPTRQAGIVLAGDSRSGKSTLALALMLRGFVPFSDDVGLIDPGTLEMQPLKRAFHVSPDSRRIVERLSAGPLWWDADEPDGFFTPPQWAEGAVPVRWVLFPDYHPDHEPELLPMAPSEAATTLLSHSPNLAGAPRMALDTVARLVEEAEVCRFRTGDIEATVAMVQQLVASAGLPQAVG